MKLLDKKLQNELIKCTHCGTCRTFCPVFLYMGKESYNTRGRIFLLEGLLENKLKISEEVMDRIYSCSMCKACDVACPSSVKFTKIMKSFRSYLADENIRPLEDHYKMANAIKSTGNVFGKRIEITDISPLVNKLPNEAPNLLYLGCVVSTFYPNLAKTMIKILSEANYQFTMMKDGEYCCSSFLDLVGLEREVRKAHEINLEKIKSRGVKNVTTICPFCYGAFYELSKETKAFSTQHSTELLLELVNEGKIKFKRNFNATVTYFDPCHLGRYHKLYDIPRNLIKAVPGVKLVEMEKNKESSMCCGGTIRVPYFDIRSGMSELIVKNAYYAGAKYIITACPSCYHNLNTIAFKYDLAVCNIEELIGYSMGNIKEISKI